MTITEDRVADSLFQMNQIKEKTARIFVLKDKGYSNVAIAEDLQITVSEVRTLLSTPKELRDEALTNVAIRELGVDCSEMVKLDRFVSEPEKLDIVKEFISSIPDEHYEKYRALPQERQAYLLRLYAEKNYDTNLGIAPYTS